MKYVLLLPIMLLIIILDGVLKSFSNELTISQFLVVALISILAVVLIKKNKKDAISATCLFVLLGFVIF